MFGWLKVTEKHDLEVKRFLLMQKEINEQREFVEKL